MCRDADYRSLLLLLTGILLGFAQPASASLRILPGASHEADGIEYAHPSSIRYSPEEDLFYIADTGNRRIVLLRSDLEPAGTISLTASGIEPFCALPAGDGSVWVSDLGRAELFRFDLRGACAETLRTAAAVSPGRLCWGPDGKIWLIDRAARTLRIESVRPSAAPAETLRVPGNWVLEDVAVGSSGEAIIVAATGPAIWMRDPIADRWRRVGEHGDRDEDFSFPVAVACAPNGAIWISDAFRHDLRRIDAQGRLLARLAPQAGSEPPFRFPVGLAADAKGRLAILERGARRVQRLEVIP